MMAVVTILLFVCVIAAWIVGLLIGSSTRVCSLRGEEGRHQLVPDGCRAPMLAFVSKGAFTPKAKRFFRATESHEKSTYKRVWLRWMQYFSWRRIWGDALTAARIQRHNFRP